MSAFTARPRTRLFAAATLALAALSLTACNDVQGVRDEGASVPPSSTSLSPSPSSSQAGQSAQPVAPAKSTQPGGSSGGSSSSGSTGGSGGGTTDSGSDPNAPENGVPCTGANTKVTAQSVERPVNHMLITVTNTGSKVCDLYYYPAIRFQDAQSVPPVIKETQPQAVTTLAPGQSGYAGVILSAGDGSGSNGHTAKTLSVYFFDRNNNSISPAATPALPAKGVYIDDSIRVTYWLSAPQDALTY
jgi:hypothetical protein